MPYRPDIRSLAHLSQSGPTMGELRGRATKRDLGIWEQGMLWSGKRAAQVNPKELPPNLGGYIVPTEKQMGQLEHRKAREAEVARQLAEQQTKLGKIRQTQAKARSLMTKYKWK